MNSELDVFNALKEPIAAKNEAADHDDEESKGFAKFKIVSTNK